MQEPSVHTFFAPHSSLMLFVNLLNYVDCEEDVLLVCLLAFCWGLGRRPPRRLLLRRHTFTSLPNF